MAAQTEAAHNDFPLFVGQVGEPLIDALRQIIVLQQLAGIGRAIIGQGVEQRLVRIRTERDVHRGHSFVEAEHALDLAHRFFQQVGNFFRRRLMVKLLGQFTSCTQVYVELLDHMNRQTDGSRLVHDGAFDGLADPPGCIGRETEPPLRIEFFHGANQAEVALLDQIEQRETTVDVTPSDLHDQAQVALDHAFAPGRIALLRQTREVHFLFGSEQGRETDFVEVKLSGV